MTLPLSRLRVSSSTSLASRQPLVPCFPTSHTLRNSKADWSGGTSKPLGWGGKTTLEGPEVCSHKFYQTAECSLEISIENCELRRARHRLIALEPSLMAKLPGRVFTRVPDQSGSHSGLDRPHCCQGDSGGGVVLNDDSTGEKPVLVAGHVDIIPLSLT